MAEPHDLAIVGGGPAGQAAALALAGLGLRIAVVDEQARPGGQILRQPPASFSVANWLPGSDHHWLKDQAARFTALTEVEWIGRHSVIEIARTGGSFALLAEGPDGIRPIAAHRVLIAGGCQDLAVPVPGWTLPGVYAAGGIQAFLKSQRFIPGDRIVLAGTHPLQLLIAAQIVAAGGSVAAVLFAQKRGAMIGAMIARPWIAARHVLTLRTAAAATLALKRAGVPVRFGARLEAIGGVDAVTGVRAGGPAIACDTVGLCYGFVPQSILPRMAGAAMRPAGHAGGWAAVHDAWMRASIPGLCVAGETTGVAGAPAAAAGGTIAGLGIARDLALLDPAEADRRAAPVRAHHARLLGFAALLEDLADPRGFLPTLGDDTIVCRCEDVNLGALVPEFGGSANGIKLATRCGMGPCQGRNCEPSLLRLMADAGRPGDPGFTQRFPARPVPLADLADPA